MDCVDRDMAALGRRRGDVLERAEQPAPRRRQFRLGLRGLRLDHIVVAHRVAGAARHLDPRQFDKRF